MHRNVLINWSIEFGPIISFFITLYLLGESDSGFLIATGIFTALTAFALSAAFIRERRIALFPLISGFSVVLFGVITLFYQNPLIFILKDTFYNGAFALLLLVGIIFGKGLLKPMFASLFDMQDEGWRILSLRWGIFFLLLTLGNEYSWRILGREVWVDYKFWSTIATTIFGSYQIFLSRKFRNPEASPWGMRIVPIHRDKK